MIVDLTNEQDMSMVVQTRAYHFKAEKQASAITVDL
jgi:hypothetical protein